MQDINENTTLNDAIKIYPESVAVLGKYKLDTCCGGFQTIKEAAEAAGLDASAIVEELNMAMRKG